MCGITWWRKYCNRMILMLGLPIFKSLMTLPLCSTLLKGPTSLIFQLILSVVGMNSVPNEKIIHHFIIWQYVTRSLLDFTLANANYEVSLGAWKILHIAHYNSFTPWLALLVIFWFHMWLSMLWLTWWSVIYNVESLSFGKPTCWRMVLA